MCCTTPCVMEEGNSPPSVLTATITKSTSLTRKPRRATTSRIGTNSQTGRSSRSRGRDQRCWCRNRARGYSCRWRIRRHRTTTIGATITVSIPVLAWITETLANGDELISSRSRSVDHEPRQLKHRLLLHVVHERDVAVGRRIARDRVGKVVLCVEDEVWSVIHVVLGVGVDANDVVAVFSKETERARVCVALEVGAAEVGWIVA